MRVFHRDDSIVVEHRSVKRTEADEASGNSGAEGEGSMLVECDRRPTKPVFPLASWPTGIYLFGALVIVLLAFRSIGCRTDVLLGEQRIDADASPTDADADVDADADSDADADLDDDRVDADQDRDMDEADVEDGDPDEPDAEVEPLMTCLQAMLCVARCADDLLCAATCADGVCETSMDAFVTLSECALPECASRCMDFSLPDCHQCVLERCPPLALTSCLGAEC